MSLSIKPKWELNLQFICPFNWEGILLFIGHTVKLFSFFIQEKTFTYRTNSQFGCSTTTTFPLHFSLKGNVSACDVTSLTIVSNTYHKCLKCKDSSIFIPAPPSLSNDYKRLSDWMNDSGKLSIQYGCNRREYERK